jgi:predicted amidohydrolase
VTPGRPASRPGRPAYRLATVLALLACGVLLHTSSAGARSTGSTAACAGSPEVVVHGKGDVQVFAVQFKQSVAATRSYTSIASYVDCYFRRYVAPHRDKHLPGLVVFNELTAITFALEGNAGLPARLFATTPAATAIGHTTNEPLGALGGAIGLVAASHLPQIAYYTARFPDDRLSLARVFLAVSDTYIRAIWNSFAVDARRYGVTVVVGAPLPILDGRAACAGNHYPGWVACPGWTKSTSPAQVATLATTGGAHSVYVAQTPNVENVALVFGPDGALVNLQPKVNLTPIEQEIGFTPAPIGTVHAIPLTGAPGVRMGVAISLDAFQHTGTAEPCTSASDFVGCLASKHVNLLLQPEFNDGTPQCASWSTYSSACGAPAWQQLGWMLSSWYDVSHFASFDYAINPFMVGNLFDLTGDGQSAIFARHDPRARAGSYVGDEDPISLYPDPSYLSPYEGLKPGFLALTPWLSSSRVRDDTTLSAGDPGSLESCENGLVPGSGVKTGPCAENGYQPTAITAMLRLPK